MGEINFFPLTSLLAVKKLFVIEKNVGMRGKIGSKHFSPLTNLVMFLFIIVIEKGYINDMGLF